MLLLADEGEWSLEEMMKFREGQYAKADETTKKAWWVYVKKMIPCLNGDYKLALKRKGEEGLLSTVASVSDEAFILWACEVYGDRWKTTSTKLSGNQVREDDDTTEGGTTTRSRKKEQITKEEKELFCEIFDIVKEKRQSNVSKEWEREVQEKIINEEGKRKRRYGLEERRNMKKREREFPSDEIV
jgi:hypothetical protein